MPMAFRGLAAPTPIAPPIDWSGALPDAPLSIATMPAPATPTLPTPKPGFNDVGGLGDQLRTFAGHLMIAGGEPGAAQAWLQPVEQRNQQADLLHRQALEQSAEFQRQTQLAMWKQAHPDPTDFQKTLMAGGYAPGTVDYMRLSQQKAQADAMGTPFVYDSYNTATGATDKVIAPRGSLALPGAIPAPSSGPSVGMPAVGSIIAGHKYLGGPTNDPRSWQAVGGAAPATGPGGFPLYPGRH